VVAYVLGNEKHHGFEPRGPLRLAEPATWLLREGWKRATSGARGAAEEHGQVIGESAGAQAGKIRDPMSRRLQISLPR